MARFQDATPARHSYHPLTEFSPAEEVKGA